MIDTPHRLLTLVRLSTGRHTLNRPRRICVEPMNTAAISALPRAR